MQASAHHQSVVAPPDEALAPCARGVGELRIDYAHRAGSPSAGASSSCTPLRLPRSGEWRDTFEGHPLQGLPLVRAPLIFDGCDMDALVQCVDELVQQARPAPPRPRRVPSAEHCGRQPAPSRSLLEHQEYEERLGADLPLGGDFAPQARHASVEF